MDDLAGTLGYTGSSQGAVAIGSYVITPVGKTSVNYMTSFIDGVFSVTSIPPIITTSSNNSNIQVSSDFLSNVIKRPQAKNRNYLSDKGTYLEINIKKELVNTVAIKRNNCQTRIIDDTLVGGSTVNITNNCD